jgi:hypothetical protein
LLTYMPSSTSDNGCDGSVLVDFSNVKVAPSIFFLSPFLFGPRGVDRGIDEDRP